MGVAGRGEGEGVQRQGSWDQSEARPEHDRSPVPVLDGISKIRIPPSKMGVASQCLLFCGCSLTKSAMGRRASLAKKLFLTLLKEKCPLKRSV